jgi:hypothetical protein
MLSSRTIGAGALAFAFLVGAISGASALASPQSAGQPLQLLPSVEHPRKAARPSLHHLRTRVRARAALHKRIAEQARTHRAQRRHHFLRMMQAARRPAPAKAAPAEKPAPRTATAMATPAIPTPVIATPATATPAEVTPAVAAAATAGPAIAPPAATAELRASALPDDDVTLHQMVIDGQIVDVASPEEVNELDLAATIVPPANSAPAKPAASENGTQPVITSASLQAASGPPVPPPAQPAKASWIAQALAAAGGAVVAGSLGWFLIGPAPQRPYG